nr:hypothetical protein BaRGS_003539 [Batillaria attramentaria]
MEDTEEGKDTGGQATQGGGGGGDGGEGAGGVVAVVFLCPTCRSPVKVPEGGVASLRQISTWIMMKKPTPFRALYRATCIQTAATLLDRVDHEEKEIVRQKQEVTREVGIRCDTIIQWASRARDEIMDSVTSQERKTLRDLQAERTIASTTVDTLSALVSHAASTQGQDVVSLKALQSALLSEDALDKLNKRAGADSQAEFFPCQSDTSAVELEMIQAYVGRPYASDGPGPAVENSAASVRALSLRVDELNNKLADLTTQVASDKDEVTKLGADFTRKLKDLTSKVASDEDDIKSKVTKLGDDFTQKLKDLTTKVASETAQVTKVTADLKTIRGKTGTVKESAREFDLIWSGKLPSKFLPTMEGGSSANPDIEEEDEEQGGDPSPSLTRCDMCEQGQAQAATHACDKCHKRMCRGCRRLHDMLTDPHVHRVRPQGHGDLHGPERKSCPHHPDQLLCFHCRRCDISICLHCKLTSHEGHMTEDMVAAARRAKAELTGLVAKANEQIRIIEDSLSSLERDKSEVARQKEEKTRDVKVRCDLLLSWATRARDEFLEGLTTIERALATSFQAEERVSRAAIDALSSLVERAGCISGYGANVVLLKNELKSTLLRR